MESSNRENNLSGKTFAEKYLLAVGIFTAAYCG